MQPADSQDDDAIDYFDLETERLLRAADRVIQKLKATEPKIAGRRMGAGRWGGTKP